VGQYDLQAVMRATHSRASKCTFGKGKRDNSPFYSGKENMPGVGAYNESIDFKKSGPKHGFGTAKQRPQLVKKDLTPAPGQYDATQ